MKLGQLLELSQPSVLSLGLRTKLCDTDTGCKEKTGPPNVLGGSMFSLVKNLDTIRYLG